MAFNQNLILSQMKTGRPLHKDLKFEFFEKLLSSAEAEMYNHSKVFYQIGRLRISELKGMRKTREFNSYML